MAQVTPIKSKRSHGDFHFMDDEALSAKSEKNCRCGSKIFREVHRISQPKGGTSIMYECVKCGEYCL